MPLVGRPGPLGGRRSQKGEAGLNFLWDGPSQVRPSAQAFRDEASGETMNTVALAAVLRLAAAVAHPDAGSAHPADSSSRPRSPAQVSPNSPIHRPPRQVSHADSGLALAVQPTVFLPLIVWVAVPLSGPVNNLWEQERIVDPVDGWSELLYQVPAGGSSLVVRFDNPIQFDFAEIVYQDGTTQALDLSGPARNPGLYGLAPLDPSRAVDHLRVIAQATDSVAYLQILAR